YLGDLTRLSIVCPWTVLTEEMLIQELRLHRLCIREEPQGFTSQADQMLKHNGVMDSIIYCLAPREGSVAGDEHAGTVQRITASEGFYDDIASVDLVVIPNFAGVESSSARHRAVKIIGVGRTECGNGTATLRPCSGIKAVGVNDAAN